MSVSFCPKTYDPEADGRFGRAVEALRNYLANDGETRFMISEGFYSRPALDAEKKAVAEKYGDVFVPMADIRGRADVRGRFNHPSDRGMRLIAGLGVAPRLRRPSARTAEVI